VTGARLCSQKATLYIAYADLGISLFGIWYGLRRPLLGESHSDDSFGALLVDISVAISVGSVSRIFVRFSVVIW